MNDDVVALQLAVLKRIHGVVAESMELDRALAEVLRIISRRLSNERGLVALMDDAGALRLRACNTPVLQEREQEFCGLGRALAERIFVSPKKWAVVKKDGEAVFLQSPAEMATERSRIRFLSVSLDDGDRRAGILVVDRFFDDPVPCSEDLELLASVAGLMSQMVLLSRRFREQKQSMSLEIDRLRSSLAGEAGRVVTAFKSQAMEMARRLAEKAAGKSDPVLFLGERGTCRGLLARLIHQTSAFSSGPFIRVRPEAAERFCSSSTNGADGWSEAAGGTLFFSDVELVEPGLMARLAATMAERCGSRNVRVMASGAANLQERAAGGAFHGGLLESLSANLIQVPALRHRREDIPALLNYYLSRLERDRGRLLRFSPEALSLLISHDWPGNVRQVEDVVERLAATVEGEVVRKGDLDSQLKTPDQEATASPSTLCDIEKREVISALERHRWIQSRAARELGITLRQIGYRIKKYRLEDMVRERRARLRNRS